MTDQAPPTQITSHSLSQQPQSSQMSSKNGEELSADGRMDDLVQNEHERETNHTWGSAFSSLREADEFQQAGVRKWAKLANDDWPQVKQELGAWVKRLGDALFAAHTSAEAKYNVQRKINAYLRGQVTAHETLKRCTKTEELRKLLEATLMKVVSTAVQIHEQEGFPERYLIFYEQVGRGIKPEESYTCQSRLLAIEKAVRDNKRTGSDLCEGKFEELVYAPQAYLKRKFDNVGSNANKEERQDAGRELLGGKKRNRRTGSQASASSSNGSSGGETVSSEANTANIEIGDSPPPRLRRDKSKTAPSSHDNLTITGASIETPSQPERSGAGAIDQTTGEGFGAMMQEQLRQAFPGHIRQSAAGQLYRSSVKISRDTAVYEAPAFPSSIRMHQGRPSRKRQREASSGELQLESLPPSKMLKPDQHSHGSHYNPKSRTASYSGQNQPWPQQSLPTYNNEGFLHSGVPSSYYRPPQGLDTSYGSQRPAQMQPGLYGSRTREGIRQYGDLDIYAKPDEQPGAIGTEQEILSARRGYSPPQPDDFLDATSESFDRAGMEPVPRGVSIQGVIPLPAEVRVLSAMEQQRWMIEHYEQLRQQGRGR